MNSDPEFQIDQMVKRIKDVSEMNTDQLETQDAIADFLDTPPTVPVERQLVPAPVEQGLDNNSQSDYEEVRHNLQQLIADGNNAVEGLLTLATSSESPRAYEVFSNHLKALAEMNQQLMDLHQQKADFENTINKNKPVEPAQKNTNIFVGSTEELQEFLERQHG